MPLPVNSARLPWPPPSARPLLVKIAEHDAWYSGDPDRLAAFYEAISIGTTDSDADPAASWRFWRRVLTSTRTRQAVHVPLPGDIASTSASLLFSEEPSITIPEAHEGENPTKDATETEARLLDVVERGGLYHRLAEAAEVGAALGGVWLKVAWDREVADIPFVAVQHADSAVGEWRFGVLRAVTFWRVVEKSRGDQRWIRHLERHEPGLILHGLYEGSELVLGEQKPLASHDATRGLPDRIVLPDPAMIAARYVPNMRPNRLFRDSLLGQSDYAGNESLFDALDDLFTSWQREIRLARARIVVPAEYLQVSPQPDGSTSVRFDSDREVYAPLNIEPGEGDRGGVTMTQFQIRSADFERTALDLVERIVTGAGYSPQTYGLHIEGRAESGTALRLRERKTNVTRARKAKLWQQPLDDILQILLVIDRAVFQSGAGDFRPHAEIKDGLPDDPTETANAVAQIMAAGAASVETAVRMLHPEWDDAMITGEVQRIRDDQGMSVPDPTTLGRVPGQQQADGGAGAA